MESFGKSANLHISADVNNALTTGSDSLAYFPIVDVDHLTVQQLEADSSIPIKTRVRMGTGNILRKSDLYTVHTVPDPTGFNWIPAGFAVRVNKLGKAKLSYTEPTELVPTATFYVRTDGDDANDGSTDDSTNAVATLIRANALVNAEATGTVCEVVLQSGEIFAGWSAFGGDRPLRATRYKTNGVEMARIISGPTANYAFGCTATKQQFEFNNLDIRGYALMGAGSSAPYHIIIIKNCIFQDSGLTGLGLRGFSESYITNTIARNNTQDGFSLTASSARAIHIDCASYNNGTTGSSRQNYTGHSDTVGIYVNCIGYDAQDQNVTFIQDSQAYFIGGFLKGVKDGEVGSGNITTANNAKIWLAAVDAQGYYNELVSPAFDLSIVNTSEIVYRYMNTLSGYNNNVGSLATLSDETGW